MTGNKKLIWDLCSVLLGKVPLEAFFSRMAGSQVKATKWSKETWKNKLPKSTNEHQRNGCTEKKLDNPSGMNYYNCNYCPKVFVNAKFVVKHTLRRHSDNLVQLHKKILELPNHENCIFSSPGLIDFLRTEFSDLKNEVVKQTVSHQVSTNAYPRVENQGGIKPCDDVRPINRMDSFQEKVIPLPESIQNDSEKLVYVSSVDNQSSKIDELFQLHKKDLVSKEEMAKNLGVRENKIFEELKMNLLSEFQIMLMCHENKYCAEWKKHFSELQEEIRRLDEAVMINSQKINFPEISQIVEKRFEQKLQDILHSNLLYKSSKKNSNSKSAGHIHRRKKSVYTCSRDFEKEKKGTFSHRTHLSLAEKRGETSHCEKHKNKSLKNESMEFSKLDTNAICSMVDEKLRSLNIDPHIEKLSLSEYENKVSDLKNKKEALSNKYVKFSEIRNRMDSYINKMIKSRGKEVSHKKLHFSDSAIDPLPTSGNKDFNLEPTFKKEQINLSKSMEALSQISPKKLCQDHYAQGDCYMAKSKAVDTEIISTIKDTMEHPSKFSAGESSDHLEGFTCTKRILHSDVSNPGTSLGTSEKSNDVDRKNMHKSSIATKFDISKSIEDLSDLSSLSDLEE